MSDTEKVNLLQDLIGEAWAAVPTDTVEECAFWEGILIAIERVLDFNGETNNGEEKHETSF